MSTYTTGPAGTTGVAGTTVWSHATCGASSTIAANAVTGVTFNGNVTSGSGLYLNGGSWASMTQTTTLSLKGPDPKIVIDEGEIDLCELLSMMKDIRDRLLLIEENMQRHEEYPALKSIYEQYRVVEALVVADENERD